MIPLDNSSFFNDMMSLDMEMLIVPSFQSVAISGDSRRWAGSSESIANLKHSISKHCFIKSDFDLLGHGKKRFAATGTEAHVPVVLEGGEGVAEFCLLL